MAGHKGYRRYDEMVLLEMANRSRLLLMKRNGCGVESLQLRPCREPVDDGWATGPLRIPPGQISLVSTTPEFL